MKKLIFLALLFLSVCCASQAQADDYVSFLGLYDTLYFYYPKDIFTIKRLDALPGKLIDSTSNPKAFLIESYIPGEEHSWRIAVKKKNIYIVFNPLEDISYSVSNLTIKSLDFNGKGNQELVVECESYLGHSGYQQSMHELQKRIQIWNTDNLIRLFDLDFYYSSQYWWNEYVPDPTGKLDFSEREIINSGGEYICNTYSVLIRKNHLIIEQTNDCPDQGEKNNHKITENKAYKFRLTRKGLVKEK